MISALAALFVMSASEPITLTPTDDIWVYEHASDQAGDQFLRVWGSEDGPLGAEASYSCLKFKLPEGINAADIESAKLVVMSIPDVNWSADDSKAAPLQARRLGADFDEKTWDYSLASATHPKDGEDQVYGVGAGTPGDTKPFPIEIDLLKGKAEFRGDLKETILKVALTTQMNPQDASGSVYKIYSRNAENESLRPKLLIAFK